MNLIFSKEKSNAPKYATGSKPYVIDVNKILLRLKKNSDGQMENTSVYLMNLILKEEFEFAKKKKKSSIQYINPSISVELVKNIKKELLSLEIEIKKSFLLDNDSLKRLHKHVDQVIKIK